MKKRIAIIGTRGYPSYYGGFETAVRKIAPYLADQGWDVTVYGRHKATRQDDPNLDTRIRRVVTHGMELKSLSTLSYGLSAVLHAMIRRPDVALVMNCANGFWLPLLKWRSIPTAVNVDGIEWERAKWGKIAKRVFKSGAYMTAKHADTIIADAHEIARHWKVNFNRDSIFLPYGGEIPGYLPELDGHPHRSYILVVARFVPENSIPEFFQAVRKLNGKYRVVIVGSTGYGGPLDEEAKALAAEVDKVTWLGHVSDDSQLNSLWQHAGVYFHGHSVGGTNPALVQAMACGAPVVARDTPYNREVLLDTGKFVHPDASAIAEALTQQIEDSLHGRFDPRPLLERSREQYSWEQVCGGYEKVVSALSDKVRHDH